MNGWEQRLQSEIQMGNGTLLATFDPWGELEQLFAPNIDALQSRLGAFRTSVLIPGDPARGAHPELIRIEPGMFHVKLALRAGSQVLDAEYLHKFRPLRLKRTLAVHPAETLILDRWEISEERAGLLHESIPWIGNNTSAHCSLYHPAFNGLVHHRGRRWLGVMVRSETQWVKVGNLSEHDRHRLWGGERLYAPIGAGDLAGFPVGSVRASWDQVVQGPATWGALAVGPASEIEFLIVCGESEARLGSSIELMKHNSTRRYLQIIEREVDQRHLPARPMLQRIADPRVRSMCERSIDVLHALQDAGTGALMAAAEVDPHSRLSGGYGYSWPRDGGYLGAALGAFGYHSRVEHYLKFVAETQDASGTWWQRYLATGHAGPSWGRIQIDEPATVILLALWHYRNTRDLFWLEKYWPTVRKGLEFLESFHADEHPIGLPSHDLWEERMGFHAYSLGAVSAAFFAGAVLARELSDRATQVGYFRKARELSRLVREKFLAGGKIRRSFVVSSQEFEDGGGVWDEAVDSSLLGLITPFRMVGIRHMAAAQIVDLVRTRLESRGVGGILRYEGDHYRGGNPWILTTLWLASVELSAGKIEQARERMEWVLSKSTELGMLPEQVHREAGLPYWVIPLGWSHAMFLLFVRQVLDLGVEDQVWGLTRSQ